MTPLCPRSCVPKLTFCALLLCVVPLLSACPSSGGGESGLTRVGTPTPDDQACSRDSECMLVDDCCGCANGGSRQAVRAEAVSALETRAETECAERSCAAGQASDHRSCQTEAAVCRGGRCIPAL